MKILAFGKFLYSLAKISTFFLFLEHFLWYDIGTFIPHIYPHCMCITAMLG